MSLQDGNVVWENKRDIVHAGSETRSIRSLALVRIEIFRAIVESKANGEEKIVINFCGDFNFSGASEAFAESSDCVGVVVGWERRHNGFDRRTLGGARCGFIFENGGGGGVVKRCVLGGLVGTCGHVVACGRLVTLDEDIGGLAWSQHDDVGGEGFKVGGIGTNHCELVVGHCEEQGLVQCCIDHS